MSIICYKIITFSIIFWLVSCDWASDARAFQSGAAVIDTENESQLLNTISTNFAESTPLAAKRGNLSYSVSGFKCYGDYYSAYIPYMQKALNESIYKPLILSQTDPNKRIAEERELAMLANKTVYDELWRLQNNDYPIRDNATECTAVLLLRYDSVLVTLTGLISAASLADSVQGEKFMPGFMSGVSIKLKFL